MSDVAQETTRRLEMFKQYRHSEEYQAKIFERLKLNDACNKHVEARTLTWQLCARPDNPAEGAIFFIENFGWTLDPRPQVDEHDLPFILYDYQKEVIRRVVANIDSGKDLFIEKSRDMGMTDVVFVYIPLWYWLFRDGSKFLLGSYKEDLVDNRTFDSLFGRIDYALKSLPKWLLPKKFNIDKDRRHMKLINPENFNQITGDTMNPDFGRGSRQTAVLFDELGFWEWGKEAWESCSQVTNCRIANSTPHGYNFYAMLKEEFLANNRQDDILTVHWSKSPLKDQAWYEYEKERNPAETIAQELDISYTKSQEGRVYPEWSDENVEKGIWAYDFSLPLYVGWDFGRTDDTALIWAQVTSHGKLRIIDTYKNSNKHIDFFVPFVTGFINSDLYGKYNYTPQEVAIIESHKNWGVGTHFGDPSGRFITQASDYSVFDLLRQRGVVVNFRDEWKGFQKRKLAAKQLIMHGVELNDTGNRSLYFNGCMTQAAYPKIRRAGLDEVKSDAPVHNWTSHYRSAFEYLALGISEFSATRTRPYDKFPKKRFGVKRAIGY